MNKADFYLLSMLLGCILANQTSARGAKVLTWCWLFFAATSAIGMIVWKIWP